MDDLLDLEQRLSFRAGDLTLEGRIAVPDGARTAAVVCHPHPQYGGAMDSSVVVAVASALARAGVATLRFNFRGVGGSEGEYSGNFAEVGDARAALDALASRVPGARLVLGGYSFGAMVAMLAGHDHPTVERLFTVALPVPMFDASPLLQCAKPKLFVFGDRDSYCPVAAIEALAARLPGENRVVRIAGGDHFLFGFESAVGDAAADFVG